VDVKDEGLKESKKTDRILWLLNWIDDRRKSISDRAMAVVRADALLATAIGVLIGVAVNVFRWQRGWPICLFWSLAAIGLASSVVSVAVATSGLANVWLTRGQLWHSLGFPDRPEAPSFLPFHPRQLRTFWRYEDYETELKAVLENGDRLFEAAAAQFRVVSEEFHRRYEALRLSVRLLAVSGFFLLAAAVVLMLQHLGAFS